ncbi:MAG: V-type ATP synthase subunit E [Candidatus Bathyarchaeia archaeon]|nr:V-type ATP synthase subunit E [Candidatus Bathyarchaeota archaeon]
MGLAERSLEILISKIIDDAREAASSILDEAKTSKQRYIEEVRRRVTEKAEKECREIIRKAEHEAEGLVRRKSVEASIRARWRILSEKRKIVDKVFQMVEENIHSVRNEDNYLKMLERLIEEAAVAAGGGRLEVLLNKDDSRLRLPLKEIAGRVSSRLGADTTLVKSEKTIEATGGVIIQSSDGKTRVDNTLSSVIKRERERLEPRVNMLLFS